MAVEEAVVAAAAAAEVDSQLASLGFSAAQ